MSEYAQGGCGFQIPWWAEATDDTCPDCKGSGDVKRTTQGHGPDDYEVDVTCPRCGGTGAIGEQGPQEDKA